MFVCVCERESDAKKETAMTSQIFLGHEMIKRLWLVNLFLFKDGSHPQKYLDALPT